MAVESGPNPLGTPLPDVRLPDLQGDMISLHEYANGQPLLVVFACNHCPYVRWVETKLADVTAAATGVRTVAIMSNDIDEYPEDSPAGLAEQVTRAGWTFPYLLDEDQSAAHAFGAVCTPDFFLFDAQGRLAYRGAFDASSPKNGQPLTGDLLSAALADVGAGRPVPEPHRPAMGCGIKWKQS